MSRRSGPARGMAKDIKNAVKRIHNSKETATLFLTPASSRAPKR